MDTLKLEVEREDLDNVHFCIYQLLKKLYKRDRIETLIAVDSFIDHLPEKDG